MTGTTAKPPTIAAIAAASKVAEVEHIAIGLPQAKSERSVENE